MKQYNVAIVGATGLVGQELIKILRERKFPVKELRLFASSESFGKDIQFKDSRLKVKHLSGRGDPMWSPFNGIDFAFFAVDASIARQWAPIAVKSGAVVIDKSSAFRMDKNVPLIIPEINLHILFPNSSFVLRPSSFPRIIASPNCTTTPLAMVLKPINDYAKVKRVVVATYQAVSGAGFKAVQQMEEEVKQILRTPDSKLRTPFAFNVIPQIDKFDANGYTGEEQKVINETRKILEDNSIKITVTCVRVPVYVGHSEAINIETVKPLSAAKARQLLSKAKGIRVIDLRERMIPNSEPQTPNFPMPIDVAGKDEVLVGRIRKDPTVKNGINLWAVSDNLRKGAALNAVQIAEELVKSNHR